MVVCQFFLRGQCKFGTACRNEHPQQTASAFGNLSWNAGSSQTAAGAKQVAFTQDSITKDLTPMVDKPMWPLSSYGPAKYEPNVVSGQDESSEELRVKAVMALKAGNPMEYQNYENEKIGAATALYTNALANAPQVYQKAYEQSNGSSDTATASTNASTAAATSAFGKASAFGAFASSTPTAFGGKPATSAFGSSAPSAFGQTSQPAFGQSAFGQPRPQTSVFGASSTPASVFGQPSQPATSAFGQTSQPTTSAFGQTSQPQSSFIKPATGAFGSSTTGGGFGAFANNSGTNTTSAFGAGGSGNAFGSPSANAPSGGGFSAFANTGTGSSVFGSSTTAAPPTTSAFGQPAFGQSAAPSSVFGTPASSTAAAPSAFGGAASNTGASVFGTPSTTTAFGSTPTPAVSVFGQPSTTPASAFGASTNSPSVFGTSTSQSNSQPPNNSSFLDSGFKVPPPGGLSSTAPSLGKSTVLGPPDFEAALATYKAKPGADKYDEMLPPNYLELLPASAREAFESAKFEWGKPIPDFIPPVQLR